MILIFFDVEIGDLRRFSRLIDIALFPAVYIDKAPLSGHLAHPETSQVIRLAGYQLPHGILLLSSTHYYHPLTHWNSTTTIYSHTTTIAELRHRLATTTVASPSPPPSRLVPHHRHLRRFQRPTYSHLPSASSPPLSSSLSLIASRTYWLELDTYIRMHI